MTSKGQEVVRVRKLSAKAFMPVRGSEHAAGFDLASAEDTIVPAGRQALIKTDLSIAIPQSTYARIAPRSGLALKKMIDVGAGVIDYDYRGPVGVVLFNHGTEDFKINAGDRIAQLILERICMANIEEVADLPETTRGSGGFGSTEIAMSQVLGGVDNCEKRRKTAGSERGSLERYLKILAEVERAVADEVPKGTLPEIRKNVMKFTSSFGPMLEAAWKCYEHGKDGAELRRNLEAIADLDHKA